MTIERHQTNDAPNALLSCDDQAEATCLVGLCGKCPDDSDVVCEVAFCENPVLFGNKLKVALCQELYINVRKEKVVTDCGT